MISRSCFFITLAVLLSLTCLVNAQKDKPLDQFHRFADYYSKGDFINAENCLISLAEQKEQLSKEYLIALYTNFGVINNLQGRYGDALKYLNLAESAIGINKQSSPELANIYINKGRIYGIIKESDKAIAYFEQGVKIYLSLKETDQVTLFRISTAYLNLGVTYFEKKDYRSAAQYLEKSVALKLRYNLSEIALPYLNLAKTYAKTGNPERAQKYFLESIASFSREFGKDYYRTSSVLSDYGLFLRSIGKNREALGIHQKALSICLKNYGDKHTFVSMAYMLLGDDFINQSDYPEALRYYQKSLIAVVSDFNDSTIYANPSLGSVIFDIRLLENLKRKAQALERFALQPVNRARRQQIVAKSYETIGLALELISRIRSGYISTESRVYLAENEKETYIFAARIAQQLYELTKNPEYLQRMYSVACISKSAVLRSEIAENELLYRSGIPDSLHASHNKLMVDIASYSKLIQDELQGTKPDTQRINFWKDALFVMNRSKERLDGKIKALFPQHEALIHKTEPASLKEIQNHLKRGETLVEYFLFNSYTGGERELFIFLISHNGLDYHRATLDSLFASSAETIKQGTVNSRNVDDPRVSYRSYTDALYYMYEKLVEPVEAKLAGAKLIIVPDEEIAYLPFDAFIRQRADTGQTSYGGLKYLIYDYTISYGYTSSLIFQQEKERVKTSKVYAFSPDYGNFQKGLGSGFDTLQGARREIGSIFKWFNGNACYGGKATESNFKRVTKQPAIFHLAMHSQVDSSNSKYSFLIFDSRSDTIEDGRLFNYEISMSRVSSPMVVLSACNTGIGNLYHGEGVMSLTRGFILAGASSVVNTFWDVNDDASADIISDFYYHLSKGDDKDEALRKAKLNYLKTTPSIYRNPYYWAAYEVMGDKSPIKRSPVLLLLLGGFLVLASISFVGYRRWFR